MNRIVLQFGAGERFVHGRLQLIIIFTTCVLFTIFPSVHASAFSDLQSTRYTCTGDGPTINIWYGRHQTFGEPGIAQKWINVLGNVQDPERVQSLTFTLNGGTPQKLAMGPDGRRLLKSGDFNIEVAQSAVLLGINDVTITAVDDAGVVQECTMHIVYAAQEWPLPYEVDWAQVDSLLQAVQVVDGEWSATSQGVRTIPDAVGYDRLLAIGDRTWRDYEVTVAVTVHSIDDSAYDLEQSVAPGVGVNLRWQGHSNAPVECEQPRCGWYPIGASNWHDFASGTFQIRARPPKGTTVGNRSSMHLGDLYYLRARVETTPVGHLYSLKAWREGEPEPEEWTAQRLTRRENAASGSLLLVAHHVDATFGDMRVTPIDQPPLWEIFTGGIALLSSFPILVAVLIGLVLAATRYSASPRTAKLVVVATGLLTLQALLDLFADRYLALILHQYGWTTRATTLALLGIQLVQSLLMAGAWLLLIAGVFNLGNRPIVSNVEQHEV